MYKNYIVPFLFGAGALIASLALSWMVLVSSNFLYGVWHDYGGIGEGIEKYGPQNRFKKGFAQTTKEQRADLFQQITDAVRQQGDGLVDIRYESSTSGGEQLLLRKPEVVHLQDVANLLDKLNVIVWACLSVWAVVLVGIFRGLWALPSMAKQAMGLLCLVAVSTLFILIVGPEVVFNTLHVWVFPKDNQWFFYYQDSLMSTMMLAPVLFGWISVAWVVLCIACFICINIVLATAYKRIKKG